MNFLRKFNDLGMKCASLMDISVSDYGLVVLFWLSCVFLAFVAYMRKNWKQKVPTKSTTNSISFARILSRRQIIKIQKKPPTSDIFCIKFLEFIGVK